MLTKTARKFSILNMDAIVAKAIRESQESKKIFGSTPWTDDEPWKQSYHDFDNTTSCWVAKNPSEASKRSKSGHEISNITLYSWNIDFMLPFADIRMRSALAHLNHLTETLPLSSTTATIIFLQECTPSDLVIIAETPWVRDNFYLTDLGPSNWATTYYGTTTLVDRRLAIEDVFRVHYSQTGMERDAFFVDVRLGKKDEKVRFCNTHLESLAINPPLRPAQMQMVARQLHEQEVYAGIVAGDFNAIQPFDNNLHKDGSNNLKDAFIELGGEEHSEQGFTWGQQATTVLREQFGCSRMDKVYFCGHAEIISFERFGKDVLMEGEDECKQLIELGFDKPWITDHLGIKAEIQIFPDSHK